jgi:hypothetical protein
VAILLNPHGDRSIFAHPFRSEESKTKERTNKKNVKYMHEVRGAKKKKENGRKIEQVEPEIVKMTQAISLSEAL